MKLTQQEEIGLRCMMQMACGRPSTSLTIRDIAEQEALTVAYVAKLMRLLRMAGLVRSKRGQQGGYELTRSPSQVKVNDILSALGEPIYRPDRCRRPDQEGQCCVHAKDCSIRALRWGLDRIVIGLMSQCTLSDLLAGEQAVKQQVRAHIDDLSWITKDGKA